MTIGEMLAWTERYKDITTSVSTKHLRRSRLTSLGADIRINYEVGKDAFATQLYETVAEELDEL